MVLALKLAQFCPDRTCHNRFILNQSVKFGCARINFRKIFSQNYGKPSIYLFHLFTAIYLSNCVWIHAVLTLGWVKTCLNLTNVGHCFSKISKSRGTGSAAYVRISTGTGTGTGMAPLFIAEDRKTSKRAGKSCNRQLILFKNLTNILNTRSFRGSLLWNHVMTISGPAKSSIFSWSINFLQFISCSVTPILNPHGNQWWRNMWVTIGKETLKQGRRCLTTWLKQWKIFSLSVALNTRQNQIRFYRVIAVVIT